MRIVSGVKDTDSQEISLPEDNYNLIARDLCGGFNTALEFTKGEKLPITVLSLNGLSLLLNGEYAAGLGLEGIYKLNFMVYLGKYGLVQETPFTLTISHPIPETEEEKQKEKSGAPRF